MNGPKKRLHFHQTHLRSCSGSLLALMLVSTAVLVMTLIFALSFVFIVHDSGSIQTCSESAALKGAVELNVNDRAEQMNNFVARSRELVFISRQASESACGTHRYLSPLASDLLMRARHGAIRVTEEKRRLVGQTILELRKQTDYDLPVADNLVRGGKKPKVLSLEVGSMADQTSNVLASQGNDPLFLYDRNSKYVQKGSNFYLPSVNLKLPGQDYDLEFVLSPMPRSDSGKPVQAKLASDGRFKRYVYLIKDGVATTEQCKEFPSAQRITLCQTIGTLDGHSRQVAAHAVASTNCLGQLP